MRFEAASQGIRVFFEAEEAALTRRLIDELAELVYENPADPVMARLLPDAYEDETEQRGYEEVVGNSLRREKLDGFERVKGALDGPGDIDKIVPLDDAEAWLPVITDLRLAIGTRVGVDEEVMSRELAEDDPNLVPMSILHWLGWMQESLLEALNDMEAK